MSIFRRFLLRFLVLHVIIILFPSLGRAMPHSTIPVYIVLKSFVIRNAKLSSHHTEIYTLSSPHHLSYSKPLRTVILQGSAFLTLPSEKEAVKQEAVLQALSSFQPRVNDAVVYSSTTCRNRQQTLKDATRIVMATLFIHPIITACWVKGYNLYVSLKAQTIPFRFTYSPPHILKKELPFDRVGEISLDFRYRISNLLFF